MSRHRSTFPDESSRVVNAASTPALRRRHRTTATARAVRSVSIPGITTAQASVRCGEFGGGTRIAFRYVTRTGLAIGVVASLVVGLSTPARPVPAAAAAAQPSAHVMTAGQQFTASTAADLAEMAAARDTYRITLPPPPKPATRPSHDASGSDPITAAAGRYVTPVAGVIPTAGAFGKRVVAGCSACSTNHRGLDFAAPTGTPVRAVSSGVVISAGWSGGYGLAVVIRHSDGTTTRSAHLSSIAIAPGSRVHASQLIGNVGSTGVSTGPHLHFEVLIGSTHIDPATWITAHTS